MILLLISFIAGVLTVLAPCVLPLLPVIIGGSVVKSVSGRNSKYTIIISLGISVLLFTFLLKASTAFINVPQEVWTYISGAIILLLGLSFLFENIWTEFMGKLGAATWANKLLGKGMMKKSFWGDVIMGAALGPVFSTCSPTYFLIIATVLPVSIAKGFVYLLAYIIGLCLSLFAIAFLGEKIMSRFNAAADPNSIFKKVMGLIFIILGILIFTGYETKLESDILSSGFFDVTTIEQKLLQKNEEPRPDVPQTQEQDQAIPDITPEATVPAKTPEVVKAVTYTLPPYKKYPAPELVSPDAYINTGGQPITIGQFKGKKAVLIDFWTYSCINCQRTLPHVEAWYKAYAPYGLEIISVHTPEFAFEHKLENVEKAAKDLGVLYPIVLDNEYKTWSAFGNRFWPRKYLIDINGNVVYDHIGEGDYDGTENAIKAVLQQAGLYKSDMPSAPAVPTATITAQTPEIYFGSERNSSYLGNGTSGRNGTFIFETPSVPDINKLYLSGSWNINSEYASPNSDTASVTLKYSAKNVYMVAGSATPATIDVYIDGTKESTIEITDQKLYPIYSTLKGETHTLELRNQNNKNLQLFTFTFG